MQSQWAGHNPYVTEANVRSIDLANGGGFGRFASNTPPQFRSVLQYEGNRALAASNMNMNGNYSPRRGFFRTIFGR